MKKNEIIIIFAIIGTFVVIATSLPLIEVSVAANYLEIQELSFEKQVHINYPVTVEMEWNSSAISYDLLDDRFYIYWTVPIAQYRDIDFHIETINNPERLVLLEDEFIKFQQGKPSEKIIEKDRDSRGTLSFISNTSGKYVFVCILDSDFEKGDEFSVNVSWLSSTLENEITGYRTEIEYMVKIETRTISKKVSISQKLFGIY